MRSSRRPASPAYILFVWDFVAWARERKIPAARAARRPGSIILYLLGIADVDPIEYGLTFERFLNPERVQMPDIDMDFADERRDEVIQYVHRALRRATTSPRSSPSGGCWRGRPSAMSAGRSSYPLDEVERVAKLIPHDPGRHDDRQVARAEPRS